jgi:hypothetical protein
MLSHRRFSFFVFLVLFSLTFRPSVGIGQGTSPMKASANDLADKLRKLNVKKVAVLPITFVEDKSAIQLEQSRNPNRPGNAIANTTLSGSGNSLRVAEEMQRFLAEASMGDFGVVPSDVLFERIELSGLKPTDFSPSDTKNLIKAINSEGDIDAVVVNTLRTFHLELPAQNGSSFLGPKQNSHEWSLLSCSDRTILAAKLDEPKFVSLAEAVYDGLSVEYFRYQNGKLTSLLAYSKNEINNLPLLPSDPMELFDKDFLLESPHRVHPILNSNCPFRVDFLINERSLPLLVAESKDFFSGASYSPVMINLEPGEEPSIRIENKSSQQVMVAVFIDGINILGKARQLPDESCRAWLLDQKKTTLFDSWWTGDQNTPVQQSRFVIEDWRESVAGKLGLSGDSASSRAITIVFFTVGFPKRQDIQFFPRHWLQRTSLSSDRNRIFVKEEMEAPGNAGAAPIMFGMGEKAPKPGQLDWVQGATVGTILASMQVRYCPGSETEATFQKILSSEQAASKSFTIVRLGSGQ